MKPPILLAAFVSLIVLSSCVFVAGGSDIKFSSLPPEGKTIPIQPFTAIKADGVFNLILQQGNTESVVVKGDYPSDLKITNDGNTLIVMDTLSNHTTWGIKKTDIYVTYKQLDAIETESVGKIKTLDTIRTHRFTFESDGVGENVLLINADSVTTSINGVGADVLAGKANYASLDDNGVGALKARDFKVKILHASVNGVGSATVYADSLIYLNVSGVGGVTYYGSARVMENETDGVGKVRRGE